MSQVNKVVYTEFAQAVSDIISDVNQAVKKRSKKGELEEDVAIND